MYMHMYAHDVHLYIIQEHSETIVVGAVGSGAPWFLTSWAEGRSTEVEFMIDTGCQVTILAMSVFGRMCVSDPRMCSDCVHVDAGWSQQIHPR